MFGSLCHAILHLIFNVVFASKYCRPVFRLLRVIGGFVNSWEKFAGLWQSHKGAADIPELICFSHSTLLTVIRDFISRPPSPLSAGRKGFDYFFRASKTLPTISCCPLYVHLLNRELNGSTKTSRLLKQSSHLKLVAFWGHATYRMKFSITRCNLGIA